MKRIHSIPFSTPEAVAATVTGEPTGASREKLRNKNPTGLLVAP
jgi:hypothetical protein